MPDGKINVLFVCKDNSIRSIIAQALLSRFSGNRFRAFSCGLEPAAKIHPRTLEMLTTHGLPVENTGTCGASDFLLASAPEMDFVINLCDEPIPRLPGNPFFAHWGITDPLSEAGDAAREAIAFRRTFRELENRIRLFAVLRHQLPEERPTRKEARAEAA